MVGLKVYLTALLALASAPEALGLTIGGRSLSIKSEKRGSSLQDIVTWDEHSIFVRGERILFYSGEFHPFRLPVPGLWLDVFQKMKAMGFSGCSFYTDWALLEGKQGNFTAEGVFDLKPFFDAASQAGIYLLARPGPYINAEVSGGGYPGWLQRTSEILRTPDYVKYTENYIKNIGKIISDGQITKGGPVILVQPENEYSQAINPAENGVKVKFPDPDYFAQNEKLLRDSGIVVPFISNDASPKGLFAPGNGTGAVDIYGYDAYPLGFNCDTPYLWPDNNLPGDYLALHEQQSPTTPNSIVEFQGGSFDPWGGPGFDKCSVLLNDQFERVFYKNNFGAGVTVFNIYMTYGGTNWGNLGYALGYTSYDYGAAIKEDRTVVRAKYSEGKLMANFLQASPDYLTAAATNSSNGSHADSDKIAVAQLTSDKTSFYVVRHAAYNTNASQQYKLKLSTSKGDVTVPQLNGTLSLNGRDSKISVSDYSLGKAPGLIYSSADIFTWKVYDTKTVLVMYGGANETHEAAFDCKSAKVVEGSHAKVDTSKGYAIVSWSVDAKRSVVQVGTNLFVYLLSRDEAYNYWTLDLPQPSPVGNFTSGKNTSSVVVKAGYLLRTANINGDTLALTGDVNCTTPVEVIGAPSKVKKLTFNGAALDVKVGNNSVVTSEVNYRKPDLLLPKLGDLQWKFVDSLPEIQKGYDDSKWTTADHKNTSNPNKLHTPVSLYASDYGYNNGYLLFRGHFTANGKDSSIFLRIQGGTASGYSAWLNDKFVGSYPGISINQDSNQTLTLPKMNSGDKAILTILLDNNSLDEENAVGSNTMKNPRGILDYNLAGHPQSDISWKLTGNLGGENYQDHARGPINEGGLYAERQGFHLPKPQGDKFKDGKPTDGLKDVGVNFYVAEFDLEMPQGYDIPLSFVFKNSTGGAPQQYRSQLYVNGYQFGKYANHIGPQTSFPVPEGILNYHGTNYIALSLWAMSKDGAQADLTLESTAVIQSGFGAVELSPQPAFTPRPNAY